MKEITRKGAKKIAKHWFRHLIEWEKTDRLIMEAVLELVDKYYENGYIIRKLNRTSNKNNT